MEARATSADWILFSKASMDSTLVYVIARKPWALDCFLWEGSRDLQTTYDFPQCRYISSPLGSHLEDK